LDWIRENVSTLDEPQRYTDEFKVPKLEVPKLTIPKVGEEQ